EVVPAATHPVGDIARGGQPAAEATQVAERAETAGTIGQGVVDALGRHGGGRVHAYPAAAGQPDLGPGVGIGAAHDPVVAVAVVVAADVAGHHARGDAGRAHQHHERGTEVFAEPGLLFEQ